MKVTVTGATGLIGRRLVARLLERGDEVSVLSRSAEKAREALPGVEAFAWDPLAEAAPVAALAGRDAVVHLAGETVAQRWTAKAKQAIRQSRETGTHNLVEGLRLAEPRPAVLLASSAVGIYGKHGDERVPESSPPGDDFLAAVCVAWERESDLAGSDLGMRVVKVRTGVVLAADGGALKTMLPAFKVGAGGPIAGGGQYLPWIHVDDIVGIYLAALDDDSWAGAVNATAPEPVTNREFSKALGKALHRPAVAPVPGFAVRALMGEMATVVTEGQRAVPERTLELGYRFAFGELPQALGDALR